MTRIPTIELYETLTCEELTVLICKVMREKEKVISERITEDFEPLPYRYNHFIIIQSTQLILLRVAVEYWFEPGVGLTYWITEADRYRSRKEYEFYQSLYDHGDLKLLPRHLLN